VASRSQTEQQNQTVDLDALLTELANKIERLKTLYEQYFMGIEKIEPQVPRKEVTRVLLNLQQQYIRNTALRFRFNTMLQKWNIYLTYWNRVLREIENGTYVRHLAKARRKLEAEGAELPPEMQKKALAGHWFDEETKDLLRKALEGKTEPERAPKLDAADLEEVVPESSTQKPGARGKPQAPPPLPSSLPKIPGMSEPELRELHRRYVDAQKAAGVEPAKFESLVGALAKKVPALQQATGATRVRFTLSVENGRPIVKATPQK
jgi:hypothetical protein